MRLGWALGQSIVGRLQILFRGGYSRSISVPEKNSLRYEEPSLHPENLTETGSICSRQLIALEIPILPRKAALVSGFTRVFAPSSSS